MMPIDFRLGNWLALHGGPDEIDRWNRLVADVEVSLEHLEALQRDRERLRAALRPFVTGCFNDNDYLTIQKPVTTLSDIKEAYWALYTSDRLKP